MPRPLKLDITESLDELKILLGQQKSAQGKERVQALYRLKRGEVKTVTDLAQGLGRHRATMQEWLGGQKTRKKQAIIAVARKLLIRCWTLLRKQERWDAAKALTPAA